MDELATRYRVIAPCLPGFGYSSKHAVDRSFDAQIRRLSSSEYLDIQRCIVVGHSLGGALAMEWVGQSQSEFRGWSWWLRQGGHGTAAAIARILVPLFVA